MNRKTSAARSASRISTKKTWIEMFWAKVQITEGCWEWTGHKDRGGYGRFGHTNSWSVSYRESGDVLVHRISWTLHNGPIPEGLWVLHRCDNRPCTRPDHLFLGTHKDNTDDMVAKGRHRTGFGDTSNSPLSALLVLHMRELWKTGRWTQQDLAEIFGITQSGVGVIVRGETWRHLL